MQTWTSSQPEPSPRAEAVALAPAIACDAMSDLLEAAEFFDVEVDHLAGMSALAPAHRLGRLQRLQQVKAQPAQDAADGRRRHARLGGDLLAGTAPPAQFSIAARVAGDVWLGDERGLGERSRKPFTPSALNRSTDLATVFAVVLN